MSESAPATIPDRRIPDVPKLTVPELMVRYFPEGVYPIGERGIHAGIEGSENSPFVMKDIGPSDPPSSELAARLILAYQSPYHFLRYQPLAIAVVGQGDFQPFILKIVENRAPGHPLNFTDSSSVSKNRFLSEALIELQRIHAIGIGIGEIKNSDAFITDDLSHIPATFVDFGSSVYLEIARDPEGLAELVSQYKLLYSLFKSEPLPGQPNRIEQYRVKELFETLSSRVGDLDNDLSHLKKFIRKREWQDELQYDKALQAMARDDLTQLQTSLNQSDRKSVEAHLLQIRTKIKKVLPILEKWKVGDTESAENILNGILDRYGLVYHDGNIWVRGFENIPYAAVQTCSPFEKIQPLNIALSNIASSNLLRMSQGIGEIEAALGGSSDSAIIFVKDLRQLMKVVCSELFPTSETEKAAVERLFVDADQNERGMQIVENNIRGIATSKRTPKTINISEQDIQLLLDLVKSPEQAGVNSPEDYYNRAVVAMGKLASGLENEVFI